jgi:hypothetical protein
MMPEAFDEVQLCRDCLLEEAEKVWRDWNPII